MSDFDGVGLVAGVVRGARSFNVDRLGRLTGIHYQQIWTPGENTAECRATPADQLISISFDALLDQMTFALDSHGRPYAITPAKPKQEAPKGSPPGHEFEKCKCGFYGYYDGSDDYHEKGTISAVIEGYGETIIGSRGFRSMRARIVAIRIPKAIPIYWARLVERNYPEIPRFASFRSMVEEFPPDIAELDGPSPADEDFWTREA